MVEYVPNNDDHGGAGHFAFQMTTQFSTNDNNYSSPFNSVKNLNKSRHCAFCLKLCKPPVLQRCSRCKKRTYCSKQCQLFDWSVKGIGQRHKNWCGLYEYGEEDVDWKIVPVLNKGLGIIAQRFFPAGSRILIEPVFTDPYQHPGMMDLEPKSGSLDDKFRLNAFNGSSSKDDEKHYVGLRLSRLNHSCQPNAEHVYDDVACVAILFAQRDIQPGEEICIDYTYFGALEPSRPTARLDPKEEFQLIQSNLLDKFGITCPDDCFCKNYESRKLILDGRKLHEEVLLLASKVMLEDALIAGEKLLEVYERLNISLGMRAALLFTLFEIAVANSRTVERAKSYIQSSVNLRQKIAPYSNDTKRLEGLLKHPESYDSYLCNDN